MLDYTLLEASGVTKSNSQTWNDWYDETSKRQKQAMKEVLPSASVLEEIRKRSPRCLQTFFWYSDVGIGVLSTNEYGETYCQFIEQYRYPPPHTTCSSYEHRYGMILPIRTALLNTQRAQKKGLFKRCNRGQYIKGGEVRRLAS